MSNCFDNPPSPAISLLLPGFYHMLRGRSIEGLCWLLALAMLLPTVIGGLVVWLLCYSSAVRLSRIPLPMPHRGWVRAHSTAVVRVQPSERTPNEVPIRPDQMEMFRTISPDMDLNKVRGLGERQAEIMLTRLRAEQVEHSKTYLRKFYDWHGYSVPEAFIDYLVAHPDEAFTLPKPSRWAS